VAGSYSLPPPFGAGEVSPELRRDVSMPAGWTSSAAAVDVDVLGESACTSC
jgi:hypothetical protein